MSEETKSVDELRVEQMDRAAEHLLKLVHSKKTSDAQKGRLFNQVLSYYKSRAKLVPSQEGNKLKEMTDAIQSKGNQRGGSSGGRGSGHGGGRPQPNPSRTSDADGRAIRRIIASLPSYGQNPGGNPKDSQRKNGSAPGADRSGGAGAPGNGEADVDGAGRSGGV